MNHLHLPSASIEGIWVSEGRTVSVGCPRAGTLRVLPVDPQVLFRDLA